MDNPHHTSTTVDRADLMSVPPQSLQIGSEKTQETGQQLTKYPKQTLLHQLKSVSVYVYIPVVLDTATKLERFQGFHIYSPTL